MGVNGGQLYNVHSQEGSFASPAHKKHVLNDKTVYFITWSHCSLVIQLQTLEFSGASMENVCFSAVFLKF